MIATDEVQLFKVRDEKLIASKFQLPATTCSLIDKTIEDLENVRSANEGLRDAAQNYRRENKTLADKCNELIEQNERLVEENKKLAITREWLEGIASGAVSTAAKDVIKYRAEYLQLQDVEEILEDVLRVTKNTYSGSGRFRSALTAKSRDWFKHTEKERKEIADKKREVALAKLSEEDIFILGITTKNQDDDEVDEDD